MHRNMPTAAAAMTAYGLIHSALASLPAKRAAGRLFGERARNGLYRPFYLAQSVATTAALAVYIRRLPDRELYRARGPLAWLLRTGQAAGLAYMAWGSVEVGLRGLTGLEGVEALAAGEPEVPLEPEAHGPARDGGEMRATGPFRYARHPMNLAFPPVLWLHPRRSDNLLALNLEQLLFEWTGRGKGDWLRLYSAGACPPSRRRHGRREVALAATAYLVLGSKHEEIRPRAAHGRAYEAYQGSGVPFFPPGARGEPNTIGDILGWRQAKP